MKFIEESKGHWTATDKADTYEIIRGRDKIKGTIYAVFKNRVIPIAVKETLDLAMAACQSEQQAQEWFSSNPENADKNNEARQKRRAEDNAKPRSKWHLSRVSRPALYKGRKNKSGE